MNIQSNLLLKKKKYTCYYRAIDIDETNDNVYIHPETLDNDKQ